MKRGLKIVGILVLGLVLVTVWWKAQFPSTSWRYKITIEIETPEGIKSGAAVREVRAWKNAAKLINPDVAPIEYEVIGEAVVVDLGKRGLLFGLIDWDSYEEVYNSFPFNSFDVDKRLHYYRSLKIGSMAKLQKRRPQLIAFKDLSDSKTLHRLSYEHLDDFFGNNVQFKQVIVEITDASVEWNIDNIINKFGGTSGMYRRNMFQRKGS